MTGGPGSGKSAVIARLVVLSDHDWRRTVPTEDLAADTIPPEGSIAARHPRPGADQCPGSRGRLCRRRRPGRYARRPAPGRLGSRSLHRSHRCDRRGPRSPRPGIWRSSSAGRGRAGERACGCCSAPARTCSPARHDPLGAVDLDDERYADPVPCTEYVLRGPGASMTHSRPTIPLPQDRVAAVAHAVAEAAGHSFLVALIVSRTLSRCRPGARPRGCPAGGPACRPRPPTRCTATSRPASGAEADRARDLLRPLAFATARDCPGRTCGHRCQPAQRARLHRRRSHLADPRQAGSYVVETMESGSRYTGSTTPRWPSTCGRAATRTISTASSPTFLIDACPRRARGRTGALPTPTSWLTWPLTRSGPDGWTACSSIPGYLVKPSRPGCWRRFPRRGIRTRNWPPGPTSGRFISSGTSRKTTPGLSYLELAVADFARRPS